MSQTDTHKVIEGRMGGWEEKGRKEGGERRKGFFFSVFYKPPITLLAETDKNSMK